MMTVSQISNRSCIAPHVVRYYARIGLLNPTRHPENRYQLFTKTDEKRLYFIRQAQTLGYTLSEIRKILKMSDQGHCPCREVRRILRHHIDENFKHLLELQRLQERMEAALEQWEKMPDTRPDEDSICNLIESAGGDSKIYA